MMKQNVKLNAFFESLGEEEKELVNAAVAEDFAHVHKIIDESKELRERIEKFASGWKGVLPFISVSEFCQNDTFWQICLMVTSTGLMGMLYMGK
ncbi:MAG: hypothetical protein ACLUE2_04620 [Bacteroides cellulosilyticus]